MKYLFFILLCVNYVKSFSQNNSTDWANLSKYEEQNALLPMPAKHEKRVVLIGSSIIEFWKMLDSFYFVKNFYIDRGISGQFSSQLLIRFRADVINLKPKAVIILAGSNDLANDTSRICYTRIMNNIKSMVDLAEHYKIKIFLCKNLPVADYPWRKGLHPANKIIALNKMISDYAHKKNIAILDYFTPLANKENGQKPDLTRDGVHPNLKGYKALEAVTNHAVNGWMRSKNVH